MDFKKYIFADFENVQNIEFDILGKNAKVIILLGPRQTPPIDLVQKAQPYGESVQWEQMKHGGNNALDFLLVYFLCFYIFKENGKDKEYFIYSKDKDYEPLIKYLQNIGYNVKRIENLKKIINDKSKNDNVVADHNQDISKIKKHLIKVADKKPKNKKSLISDIKDLLKKPNEEVEKIIEDMVNKKIIICEENKHLKYNLE